MKKVETNIQDEGEKEIEFFSSRDQAASISSVNPLGNGGTDVESVSQMITIVDYANPAHRSSSDRADYIIVNAVFEVCMNIVQI